jgi:hypothetical protein
MRRYLAGKKTYLVAASIAVLTLSLVGCHRLSPEVAATLLLLGVSAMGATYRSALERHHQELMEVLSDVAIAGAAAAARSPAALEAALSAIQGGAHLVCEVKQESGCGDTA